jgi:hypothetical protein
VRRLVVSAHSPEEGSRRVTDKPTIEFYDATTTISRVMSASSKQKERSFNQSAFRKSVFEFYGATRDEKDNKPGFCRLCGWLPEKMDPKTLVGEELNYLFGGGEVVLDS